MEIPENILAQISDEQLKRIDKVADTLKFTADQPLVKPPHPSLAHFPPKHQSRIHWIIYAGTDLFKKAEPSAAEHALLTWDLSKKLAQVSETYEDMYTLSLGALLHDIGKIITPANILGKASRLNNDERAIVRKHALYGALIVQKLGNFFERAVPIVLMHHEEWGGGGYPQGLLHEEVPIETRIVHLADVIAALLVDRAYRSKLSPEEARDYILRLQRDRQCFDPKLIRYLDKLI